MKSKLLSILVLLGLIFCSGTVSAQKITASYNKTPIKTIIKDLQNRYDYDFVYSNVLKNINDEVTLQVKDKSIEEVLAEMFVNKDISFKIDGKQIVLTPVKEGTTAQNAVKNPDRITVKGTVTDGKTGEPIPFASVVVKGTTSGVAADELGNYAINNVPVKATLVTSSIGYVTQETAVNGKSVLNVILANDTQYLDETIVVAYGTASKESVTGALATLKSDAIERRPVASVTDVLDGQVSGIMVHSTHGEPGTNAEIRVRGFGSVNGDNAPLYVVDGVPFGGNVTDINPSDIESLTVLKDATSAALYGNRASNGVIMITTKRGKTDKVTVNANATFGAYMRGIPEYDKVDPYQFMQLYYDGYRNYLMSSSPDKYPTQATAIAQANKTIGDYIGTNTIFNVPMDQLFTADGKFNPSAKVFDDVVDDLDWAKACERVGLRQEYTINAQSATEKSNTFFSVGYLDANGQIAASDYSRLTIRAKAQASPTKWFTTGVNVSGSYQNENGVQTGTTTIANPLFMSRVLAPIYPVHRHDMDTGAYILDENGGYIYDDGSAYNRKQNTTRNSIWESQLDVINDQRYTIDGQAFADIKFLKDFTLSIKGDINFRNINERTYGNSTIGDAINTGTASKEADWYKIYTVQELLNWGHTYGDHSIEALAGHEYYYYGYEYLYGSKSTETFKAQTELNNFSVIKSLTGYYVDNATESYLSRVKYNYRNKYYAEGSFRRDGSSRFSPQNRWGNFWSAGATWIISKEDFMKDLTWIDNLKLRASYGQVGNHSSAGYYAYMALYSMVFYNAQPASYFTQLEAQDLRWESAKNTSIALESRMFDRWNWSFEFYNKLTDNLLFNVNLPLSAGATAMSPAQAVQTKNIGVVVNRGFEINTDVDIIRNRNLVWNFGFNTTYLHNKVLALPEENEKDGIISGNQKIMIGHGIYDWWVYKYVGVDQMTGHALYEMDDEVYYFGNKVDGKSAVPADWATVINGKPYVTNTTYAKKDWCGSAMPKFYGSFNTSLTYKSFTLSAIFTYGLGSKVLDSSYRNMMSVGTTPHSQHPNILKAWTAAPAGMTENAADRVDPDGVPVIDYYWDNYSNAESSRFLLSGNYFVVRNVALRYDLPKKAVQSLGISRLGFSASVDNLLSVSVLKGMNPQQAWDGSVNNRFNTPRIISAGVNVTL